MISAPLVKAWSWSRYADYKQCPLKFKLKHIDGRKDAGSAAMDRGNTIHKLAEDYVVGKIKTLPKELVNFKEQFGELKTMKPMVEQAWGFKRDWTHIGRSGWFGDDVWLRSKADVFAVYDDNTGDLIDHKTGKKYESNKEQVELFSATAFMRVPTLERVTTRLWYLDQKDDNEVIAEYTRSDFELIVKDWEKKVQPMFADRKFAPRPNDKCKWCSFSRDKGGPCKF